MSKIDEYCRILEGMKDWDDYLRKESGLPGPRGNLELARAAAMCGDAEVFRRYIRFTAEAAPENTPDSYLAFVGVWGLGWQVAKGGPVSPDEFRPFASDARWRTREAAAIALQTIGDGNVALFREIALAWSRGNRLEQRAAVAAVAEPRLLHDRESSAFALALLERVTSSLDGAPDAAGADGRILRKALGYAWSVVVVAEPSVGQPAFEALLANPNPDVRWIVKENLTKKRLERMDAGWCQRCRESIL